MDYTNISWRDGQPYSEMFDDIYYSSGDDERIAGREEFRHVFFRNNGLPERWHEKDDFVITELGLGSCLNCLLTIQEWMERFRDSDKVLHYIAIERYPLAPEDIERVISRYSELRVLLKAFLSVYPSPVKGVHSRRLFDGRVIIQFRFMDVDAALDGDLLAVDAWYLDGFSPSKNPEMWSRPLFQQMVMNSSKGATISTYTAAGSVRRHLVAAGLEVEKVSGCGNKREMLVARLDERPSRHYTYTDRPWFRQSPATSSASRTAMIVGAGIAGLSVALALVRRGFDVTVLDSDDAAHAGSSNPAAIIYPRLSVDNDTDNEFYLASYCYAGYMLRELQKQYDDRFWIDTGLLQFYDKARFSKMLERYRFSDKVLAVEESGYQDMTVTDDEVVVSFPEAGVVIPENLLTRLIEECGCHLKIVRQHVDRISHPGKAGSDSMIENGDHWACHSSGGTYEAEVLVLANGSAAGFADLPSYPIDKIRGQMVTLRPDDSSNTIKQAINSDCYITSVVDGRRFLGSTFSRDNMSTRVDDNDNQQLIECANTLGCGVIEPAHIESSWVGFRYMARDRVPIVGPVPDRDFLCDEYSDIAKGRKDKVYAAARPFRNLYVSAAHGSRGFTTSFLCAEILAAQICGEPVPVSRRVLDYLNPSRFILDELKRS